MPSLYSISTADGFYGFLCLSADPSLYAVSWGGELCAVYLVMKNKNFRKSYLNKTLIQPPEKGRWQTGWNTKQRVCLKLLDLWREDIQDNKCFAIYLSLCNLSVIYPYCTWCFNFLFQVLSDDASQSERKSGWIISHRCWIFLSYIATLRLVSKDTFAFFQGGGGGIKQKPNCV